MNTRDCDLSNNNIRRAVILTPAGRGAVATILVEGDDADRLVSRYFHPASGKPLTEIPIGHIIFGRWTDGDGAGEETVVCCRSANCVEVNCHGGRIAAEAVMRTLEQAGCEAMRWQDWVSRTESDPISAEARQALAAASTLRAAGILLDQYRGALRSAMISIIDYLHRNEITEAVNQLNELLRHTNVGLHLVQPWRVVLAGDANVGKSSLINAMLGFERSIVFDQPGTTRDVLTAHTALDGWPVELADTAGLRTTSDAVESEGVAVARQQIAEADLVVLVFDASRPWRESDEELKAAVPNAIVVFNKSDIAVQSQHHVDGLMTSALTSEGIDQLIDQITHRLVAHAPKAKAAVPFTERHVEAIRSALAAVQRGDPSGAIQRLTVMIGR